ncbi:MAG TPA: TAT-variant-translocated molybdopterin oxidoreductase, partial [Rubricoccaceae bacterium]
MIELDVLSAADLAADDDARAADGRPLPWRSAADRDGAPGMAALRHHEFAPGAAPGEEDAATSRRTFLKVMGASAALAGLTGCRRPVETIVPYARKPQEIIPGLPNFFATAMPFGGVGQALLVQSHEGRPVKIEGNPEHPVSRGASDVFSQASVLQLYDPDRSRHVWHRGEAGEPVAADWGGFVGEAGRLLGRAGALRVAVLAEPTSSPTLLALRDRFAAAYPNARWITLGAHGDDHEGLGLQAAFGRPVRPLTRFSEADVVVSFDGDFLGDSPNSVWNGREYAESRRADVRRGAGRAPMSRLYVAESTMTMTGGMADHRVRMKAGAVPFFAAAVAAGLGLDTGARAAVTAEQQALVTAIVQDVRAAGGRAAFVAGSTQPPAVHALVAALNGRFGAQTTTYLAVDTPPVAPVGPAVEALVRDMTAGNVDAVVMLGTNPVYTLPTDLNFAEALARVPVSIHHGLYRDETGQRATWHLPAAHYLESWGDVRAYDGTLSVIQPLIQPLYGDAHSDVELLNALVTGRNNAGYDLVRRTMQTRLGGIAGNAEDAWRTALHDGFVGGTAYPAVGAGGGAPSLAGLQRPADGDLEVVFRTHPTLYDGSFSNVAWMQEAPHPITKTTWDPIALVSRATAQRLGLGQTEDAGKAYSSVVQIQTGDGKSARMPVWVQPGHPDDSVTVYLGYGRAIATDRTITERGVVGRINTWLRPGHAETDVYRPGPVAHLAGAALEGGHTAGRAEGLRSLANMTVFPGAALTKVGENYLVASTQDHGSMEGRAIVRVGTLDEYREDPKFAQEEEHFIEETPWEQYPPLWGQENSAGEDPRFNTWLYSENQWGMTIDLNACSGCNACVVACQSENNVPVVGKDQVARGREMHWLRLDRYYVGSEDDPGMVAQPMFCQHCENAPCEQVCPVNATSHSPDGLNEMTYNRCIGTRYCANNCPYKVRRYNFYNWTKTLPIEVQMANNPYVTVRYRGVMEKCTFCVQRIRQNQQYA